MVEVEIMKNINRFLLKELVTLLLVLQLNSEARMCGCTKKVIERTPKSFKVSHEVDLNKNN